MKMSRRAKRMERQHVRHGRGMALNLVSLMDIFTILVFFLLVNTSDGEILPTHKSVELPESISEQQPRVNVTLMVNKDNVLLHGQVISSVANIMKEQGSYSKVLQAALIGLAGDRPAAWLRAAKARTWPWSSSGQLPRPCCSHQWANAARSRA